MIKRCVLLIVFVLINVSNIIAQARNADSKVVLILTSYSADSRRVLDFINEFEKTDRYDLVFKIENMNFRGLNECHDWNKIMSQTVDRYRHIKLRGVILLGQEAWGTYLGLKEILDAPFYGCYISETGIIIPNEPFDESTWDPQGVNTIEYARKRGVVGAIVNKYDVETNVKLIQTIYPSINNIAFICDNSYGGMSLMMKVKRVMKEKFPRVKLTLLDARVESEDKIAEKIAKLDAKSAVIIGTWRLNKDGVFFIQSGIGELFKLQKLHIPIFTITGTGIETIAMGGYMPNYNIDIAKIIDKFKNINDKESFTKIIYSTNQYIFSNTKLNEYGIRSYQLPKGSIIKDESTLIIERYRMYIVWGVIASAIFLTALIISVYFYLRNRKVNKILKFQQDILKSQKEELKEAKEIAENSDKLKSTFLANMSHEIRTPLNAIVGFSELIKDTEEQSERDEYWKIISTNSDLLLRLIGDILDLSKIESGVLELKTVKFDMAERFGEVYSTLKQRVTNPDVELIAVNPYKKCIVELDVNRLTQVITNFVTNSIKFTPKGSITMGYEYVNNGIKVYCKDTGIGIAKDKIGRVFGRFVKLDTFAQGTGLGMAICKAIAEANGGDIGVESEAGVGTLFWAWLPCEAEIEK